MGTSTFRKAVVRTPDGPDAIEIVTVPVEAPGPEQLRVRVTAASVNPVDIGVASGVFHALGLVDQPEYTGLGWDFAGTVAAVGDGVDLAIGTPVAGLVAGFDRDYGTFAEQVIVAAADVAVVPDDIDPVTAATVPLNALAAAQLLDLLGDAPARGDRLLVTGAAGAVGGYLIPLARERGWRVTGLARAADEKFVRELGADFTTDAETGWDAVADAAAMQRRALALVRDGGVFVGVQPSAAPTPERGVEVRAVTAHPDGARLAGLLERVASGELPTSVHAVLPLERAADALRAVAAGGTRGRHVLRP